VGALAGVVVSSGRRAVLGPPPGCVSLAPALRRPRPLLLLPSGIGGYSANKSEEMNGPFFCVFSSSSSLTEPVLKC